MEKEIEKAQNKTKRREGEIKKTKHYNMNWHTTLEPAKNPLYVTKLPDNESRFQRKILISEESK